LSSSADDKSQSPSPPKAPKKPKTFTIHVKVPSFHDRTHFLRARLGVVSSQLEKMSTLKFSCDRDAHRSARRIALSGFAALITYWTAVARLTFWDLGWETMEPVTYLSGLSTVICGYLWFLYQGREVSYSSILSTSISARRNALYLARGLDIARHADLDDERQTLVREIHKIALDYDVGWKEGGRLQKEKEREKEHEEDASGDKLQGSQDSQLDLGAPAPVPGDKDKGDGSQSGSKHQHPQDPEPEEGGSKGRARGEKAAKEAE